MPSRFLFLFYWCITINCVSIIQWIECSAYHYTSLVLISETNHVADKLGFFLALLKTETKLPRKMYFFFLKNWLENYYQKKPPKTTDPDYIWKKTIKDYNLAMDWWVFHHVGGPSFLKYLQPKWDFKGTWQDQCAVLTMGDISLLVSLLFRSNVFFCLRFQNTALPSS